jgi:hypothetical protein
MDRQLDAARAANAGLVRADLGWSSLEQDGPGQWSSWYLDKVDTLVEKAQARGLKLLLTVTWTPCWASTAPPEIKQDCAGPWWSRGVQYYPPANPGDYANALAFLVARYGDRVAGWEVWNEPNSSAYLRGPDPAGAYAALLKAAYPAAKQANPGATVLGGSLMNADATFAEALYQHGIKGYFDAFAIHPYNGDRSPNQLLPDRQAAGTFTQGVPLVHQVMLNHGDDKPMWLTELGWNTSTTRNSDPWLNGVDEATQALYLTQAYTQMARWSYVQVGVWYELLDGPDRADAQSNFGLLRVDYSEKPAYAAFRDIATRVSAGDLPTTGSPGSGTTGSKPGRHRATLRISLRRRGGRVYATGEAPGGARVKVRLLPRSRRARAASRRALRVQFRATRSGRFSRRLRSRALRRGHWLAVATAAGRRATARI